MVWIVLLPGSTPAFQSSVVDELGGAWGQDEFDTLLIPSYLISTLNNSP